MAGSGASGRISSNRRFEGGTLWFKRKAAVDSYRQSAALYRQTVLRTATGLRVSQVSRGDGTGKQAAPPE